MTHWDNVVIGIVVGGGAREPLNGVCSGRNEERDLCFGELGTEGDKHASGGDIGRRPH